MTAPAGRGGESAGIWIPFIDGLRAFLARRLPDQEVEDVLQDILIRIHEGAASLRDAARAESWVYGIARRSIADFYRERARRLDREGLDGPVEPAAGEPGRGLGTFPGSHSVHEEVLSWLEPMARSLPEGYRRALLLADFQGRPQAEVARELGLTLSGAKSRIQRARKMLRRELQRCCHVHLGPDGRVVDFQRRRCGC